MKDYFAYELPPMPTSLFNYNVMRKSKKSSLAAHLTKDVAVNRNQLNGTHKFIEGGALLH